MLFFFFFYLPFAGKRDWRQGCWSEGPSFSFHYRQRRKVPGAGRGDPGWVPGGWGGRGWVLVGAGRRGGFAARGSEGGRGWLGALVEGARSGFGARGGAGGRGGLHLELLSPSQDVPAPLPQLVYAPSRRGGRRAGRLPAFPEGARAGGSAVPTSWDAAAPPILRAATPPGAGGVGAGPAAGHTGSCSPAPRSARRALPLADYNSQAGGRRPWRRVELRGAERSRDERGAGCQAVRVQDDRGQRAGHEGAPHGPGDGERRGRARVGSDAGPSGPAGPEARLDGPCRLPPADRYREHGVHAVRDPAEGGVPLRASRFCQQGGHEAPEGHLLPSAHQGRAPCQRCPSPRPRGSPCPSLRSCP